MKNLRLSAQFIRDAKRLKRKYYDMIQLEQVLQDLREFDQEYLARKYRDRRLKGNLRQFRGLHIDADWLLVYQGEDSQVSLLLVRTGSRDSVL